MKNWTGFLRLEGIFKGGERFGKEGGGVEIRFFMGEGVGGRESF